jgi:hypothetical protein
LTLSRFLERTRVPFGFLLGIAFAVLARPNPVLLPYGLGVAFAGLLLRAWAAGHIDKNSELTVSGPYAHVRNPLYVGTFLLGLGFALACSVYFLALALAFFLVYYTSAIDAEKHRMERLFPQSYPEYAANVPLVLPRITPWRVAQVGNADRGFRFERYLRNAEWKAAIGYALVTGWLVLRLNLGV